MWLDLIFFIFITGIFSHTSTWVLGVKSPSSPLHVGSSGICSYMFFSSEIENAYLDFLEEKVMGLYWTAQTD